MFAHHQKNQQKQRNHMITLKLKTTEASGGVATLTHPLAKVGEQNGTIVYQVVEIPLGESIADVVRIFNLTCTITGHVFKFSDFKPDIDHTPQIRFNRLLHK